MSLTAAESLEIIQLVTRADNCATARDANGYAELFTEDGVMTGDKGSAREELRSETPSPPCGPPSRRTPCI